MERTFRLLSALSLAIAAPCNAQAQEPVAAPVQAPPGKAFDTTQTLTRIALGSCNRQYLAQDAWVRIAATQPQVFLAMGDNVYGDRGWRGDAGLESFRAAYGLQAGHPQFQSFRAAVPMLVTWDDHDFGPNDGGGDFAHKQASEELFEGFWGSGAHVRGRPGVYQSVMAGPKGRRVQLILLDTRFFRSPLKGPKGNYAAEDDLDAQMLGNAQWAWLRSELAKPAELRLVVSSIQVLSQSHRWEKWANLPHERERLFRVLGERAGGGVLLLSGDRHAGGIYAAEPGALGEEVWEMTSSSLNSPFASGDVSAGEPDPLRRSILYAGTNFGLVDIDWAKREATLRLVATEGYEIASQAVGF